jgi:Mor family transcriptional regulator
MRTFFFYGGLPMPTEDEQYHALLQNLPPVLKAIIKALGLEKAQALLLRFGGTSVTIPKNHSVKLGLSDEDLNALRVALEPHLINDNRISLPKIDKIFISFRNHEIRSVREKKSLNELALQYNLCSRQIQNICVTDKTSQVDLFTDL